MNREVRIVLDAGHGGRDPGAVVGSVYEKDIALEITMKIQDYIPSRFKLIYTRKDDTFVSLEDRALITNTSGAEVFVSIHVNAAENPNAHGIETFHFPTSDTGNNLARCIQKNLINKTEANDRGVKSANFYVLRRTKPPAILVETGFITNEAERNMLLGDSYQNKIARAISSGLVDYVDNF